MQKSAIEQIKELKARLESKTEQAKAEAIAAAREAIEVFRELGLDNDTILKDVGFRGRATAKESREGRSPKDEPCQICSFRTDPPHDGRAHRGQTKKRPLAAEELEKKGLTKPWFWIGSLPKELSALGESWERRMAAWEFVGALRGVLGRRDMVRISWIG
jgi:hypothetical protein